MTQKDGVASVEEVLKGECTLARSDLEGRLRHEGWQVVELLEGRRDLWAASSRGTGGAKAMSTGMRAGARLLCDEPGAGHRKGGRTRSMLGKGGPRLLLLGVDW